MKLMVACPGCGMNNILEDSENEGMVISRTIAGECGGCYKQLILKLVLEEKKETKQEKASR